tara:strand:+ start:1908 stop:2072 length:165 start_codon:yes stop_codon:yes gene_type:complete
MSKQYRTIKVTPLQEYLIAWGMNAIRFDTNGEIKSAKNLLKKIDKDTSIRGYDY